MPPREIEYTGVRVYRYTRNRHGDLQVYRHPPSHKASKPRSLQSSEHQASEPQVASEKMFAFSFSACHPLRLKLRIWPPSHQTSKPPILGAPSGLRVTDRTISLVLKPLSFSKHLNIVASKPSRFSKPLSLLAFSSSSHRASEPPSGLGGMREA